MTEPHPIPTPEEIAERCLSLNLHRRHLTPSQGSMCAGRARAYYDQQAMSPASQETGRFCSGKFT